MGVRGRGLDALGPHSCLGVRGRLFCHLAGAPRADHDRNVDIWEPLVAIADAVGGDWPERARAAAVALVVDLREAEPSLGIRLLADLHVVFTGATELPSKTVLEKLHNLAESPWADLKGKPLDERGLAYRLRQYGIRSKTIGYHQQTPKGYASADFQEAWSRYLPSPPASATSATSATAPIDWSSIKADASMGYCRPAGSRGRLSAGSTPMTRLRGQSRLMSFVEAVTNVVVGYLLAVATQFAVFPLFGLVVSLGDNLLIGGIFTAVSLVRSFSFTVRRLFERSQSRH